MRIIQGIVAAVAAAGVAAEPTPTGCKECTLLVTLANEFSGNTTTVNQTIAALEKYCDGVLKKNGTLTHVCEKLTADIVKLLPFTQDQLATLAWTPRALCAAIGECSVPCCLLPVDPEQIYIALTGDPSEMRVSWVTGEVTAKNTVSWGLTPDGLTSAEGVNTTYTEAGWIGQIHTAKMTGLKPGTEYTYHVGSGDDVSPFFKFKTLPTGAGDTIPLRVAVVGDMGYANKVRDAA